jgi:diacylglycerol O-acyltransferase
MAGSRVEPLRPNDVFFLNADAGGAYQHVAGIAVLDPSPRPDGPVARAELAARLGHYLQLGAMPRLRQRLAFPWGQFARPAWVEASDFDLDRHVRTRRVGEPGERRQLEAAIEDILAQPLPRDRPLWELWLFDGLADGRQAVLIKMHHAIADGIGALALVEHLLDDADEDGSEPPLGQSAPPARSPNGLEVFRSTLIHQLVAPGRDLYGAARRAASDPRRAFRQITQTVGGVWELAHAGPAPSTPLNGPVGVERRVVLAEVSRAALRAARGNDGGTDNDVLLAATAAAVCEWSCAHGAQPPERLRTVVPVSTRRRRSEEPGNWTATLNVDLPAARMAPRERLRAVVAATAAAKRSHQRLGSQWVMGAVGLWAPPRLHARFARFSYRGTWFNLIVSNVPGVRRPRTLAGAPVIAAYPIIPLVQGVGLTVAAMTWVDRLMLGFTADPQRIDDLDAFAASALAFIAELAGAGDPTGRPT